MAGHSRTPFRKAPAAEHLTAATTPGSSLPRLPHDPLPDSRVKDACGAAARALRAP